MTLTLFNSQIVKKRQESESDFSTLNNSSGEENQKVKAMLEDWFKKIPESEKKRLRKDFRSDDNHTHWSGFFELFLHELFSLSDYQVEVHTSSDKTKRKPDLFMKKDNVHFYVEAITRSDSDSEKRICHRLNTVETFFKSLKLSRDILVRIKAIPYRNPDIILEELNNEIKPYLTSIIDKPIEFLGKYNINNWDLEFRIASIKKDKCGCSIIGMVDEWDVYDYISAAVEMKHPSNYKLLAKPFIIAINIHPVNNKPINRDLIFDSIFGKITYLHESKHALYTEGIFVAYDKKDKEFKYDNKDIIGLLVIDNLDAWSLADKKATLYLNPVANNPISNDILPIDTVYYDEEKGEYVTIKGNDELFNL
ncbi:MAG: hypothetical protein HZR80_02565 [Candidatus Heimdallarchaeota archaeon]